jgi:hypothetical protein
MSRYIFIHFQQALITCWNLARYIVMNYIGGVMVRVLSSSEVDCGFDPWSGKTKDYIELVFVASRLST